MTKFIICAVVAFAAIIMSTNAELTVGGISGSNKPVDTKITELVDRRRADIINKICGCSSYCPSLDAKIAINNYKTQPVAGTNYFVSVTVDDIVYHARIFSQPWTRTEKVTSVVGPKNASDEILYF